MLPVLPAGAAGLCVEGGVTVVNLVGGGQVGFSDVADVDGEVLATINWHPAGTFTEIIHPSRKTLLVLYETS